MRRLTPILVLAVAGIAFRLVCMEPPADPRLQGAFRQPEKNGWIFVHLEGKPRDVGFQHGNLLAPEIADRHKAIVLLATHGSGKNWQFFRDAAQKDLWPKIETEYRDEMEGIAEGLRAHGVKLDLWDVVALNASIELGGYFVPYYDKSHKSKAARSPGAPEHCSAFVATGSYTRDGKVVIGHNNWTDYLEGQGWNIIFDIKPAKGYRIIMDGYPGRIHSGDDFGVNSAGIMITETTITGFSGWDPPASPSSFAPERPCSTPPRSTISLASCERATTVATPTTGCWRTARTTRSAAWSWASRNVNLWRKRDGFFSGSNYPVDEKLIREETNFDTKDRGHSANARRIRWDQLMAEYKGKIDVPAGQKFLSDHYDSYAAKNDPNERTLCGHIDLSPRGLKPWQPEHAACGSVMSKVADAAMAERMSFTASMGHSCGIDFKAAEHLKQYPQFSWENPLLRDLKSHAWTIFQPTPGSQ